MRFRLVSWMITIVGVALVAFAMVPGAFAERSAVPPLAATVTAEPPTSTNTPTPTNTTAPTATSTPVPTSAPGATSTPTPTNAPGATSTPTSAPGATNTPVSTPAPTNPPVHTFADPAITKQVSATTAQVGSQLTYTLIVTNLGNVQADNVVVDDTLPNELDYVSATTTQGTITVNGKQVLVQIGTLQPGQVVTIEIVVLVNASAQPGTLPNRATVSTTSPGDDLTNNTATAIVIIVQTGSSGNPTATSTPDTTPGPDTQPTVDPGPQPTAPAAPAPTAVPARLPATGGSGGSALLLASFGLALIGLGMLLGRTKHSSR